MTLRQYWAAFKQYKGNVKDAHNVISMMLDGDTVFKKLILVQNDYTYRELDYEYGRAIVSDSVGLEEGRTTIGKVQKRKIIYRKSQDGSITKEVIDTTNITNDVHKWLADRGYSKVG